MKFRKTIIPFILAIILSLSVVLSGCSLLIDGRYPLFTPSFSARKYIEPDEEALYNKIAEIKTLSESEGNKNEILSKRSDILYALYTANTSYVVAEIAANKNIKDEEARTRYAYISSFLNKFTNDVLELEKTLFKSIYKADLIELTGEAYAERMLASSTKTPEAIALEAKETEYLRQYSAACSLENGAEKTAKMAEIYKNLIITRNDIAALYTDEDGKPYRNYLDYSYDKNFGRDYTPEDVTETREALREKFVSAYASLTKQSQKFTSAYTVPLSEAQIKKYMPYIIKNTNPTMSGSWQYLIRKGLYDFTISENKMNTSYVADFAAYGDGFMFINRYGSIGADLSTIIHEFGHYNAIFNEDEEKAGESSANYDLLETHSQCFELITLPAVKQLFKQYGITCYDSYAFLKIYDCLWALLSNCAFDEFEYTVYNAKESELTAEFFQKTFSDVKSRYIADSAYNYYDITHVYQVPGYCISYVVSLLFSSEIWANENAAELYNEVVSYGASHYLSEVYQPLKLSNPLTAESVNLVYEKYRSFLKSAVNIDI